jgi:hypothetical protein
MTLSRLAIALTLIVICTNCTTTDGPSFAITGRDPGVKRWISYEVLGPRNGLLPIVYLSTQHFKLTRPEFLTVLPQARYDIVAAYTQARFASNDCPGDKALADVDYSVMVSQGEGGNIRRCVLPKASACDYLLGIVNLPGMNWTAKELQPITLFMGVDGCNTSGTATGKTVEVGSSEVPLSMRSNNRWRGP